MNTFDGIPDIAHHRFGIIEFSDKGIAFRHRGVAAQPHGQCVIEGLDFDRCITGHIDDITDAGGGTSGRTRQKVLGCLLNLPDAFKLFADAVNPGPETPEPVYQVIKIRITGIPEKVS